MKIINSISFKTLAVAFFTSSQTVAYELATQSCVSKSVGSSNTNVWFDERGYAWPAVGNLEQPRLGGILWGIFGSKNQPIDPGEWVKFQGNPPVINPPQSNTNRSLLLLLK